MRIKKPLETINNVFEDGVNYNFLSAVKCGVICGILFHLFMLTNYMYNHDAMSLFTTNGDWLISQGKWFVTPLQSYKGTLNVGFVGGIVGIIAIGLAAGFLCMIFKIKSRIHACLIGAAMAAFPSLSTVMVYNSADYFGMTVLFSVSGAYFASRKDLLSMLVGIALMVLSLGAYQAYLGFAASIFVIICIIHLLDENKTVQEVLLEGMKYIAFLLISILVYYGILQIRLRVTGAELSSYKGMNNVTSVLIPTNFLRSCYGALKDCAKFYLRGALQFEFGAPRLSYFGILALLGIMIILQVWKRRIYRQPLRMVLLGALLALALPLSVNFVGILTFNSSFYYVSIYPFIMILICVPAVYELFENSSGWMRTASRIISVLISLSLAVCCFSWAVSSNFVYYKEMRTNKVIESKAAVLISQIQSTPDYTVDTPVVLVGSAPYEFLESTSWPMSIMSDVNTYFMGFTNGRDIIYNIAQLYNLIQNEIAPNMELGFDANYWMENHKAEIEAMAVYPNSGSIAWIEDSIIVKVGEIE